MEDEKKGEKKGRRESREWGGGKRIHCKDDLLSITAISQHSSRYTVSSYFLADTWQEACTLELNFQPYALWLRLCINIRIQTTADWHVILNTIFLIIQCPLRALIFLSHHLLLRENAVFTIMFTFSSLLFHSVALYCYGLGKYNGFKIGREVKM